MKGEYRHRNDCRVRVLWASLLLLLAQVFSPAIALIGDRFDLQLGTVWCGPAAPSDQAAAFYAEYYGASDDGHEKEVVTAPNHCALCSIDGAFLPVPSAGAVRIVHHRDDVLVPDDPANREQSLSGPPLGAQAPPVLL